MEHILTSEDGRSRVVLQANKEATVYLRDEEGASTDEWVQWRTFTYSRRENSNIINLVYISKKGGKGNALEDCINANFDEGTFTKECDWIEE